ncbi:hemiasterlin resistant protein 1-like [Anopheles maculipalpis]|uniref:hemiasterlin resistant protein 1-like n=1 Tax=Anopheles maculipalpis TaxID=1496333 RepID=UPI0021590CE5|nr:hemiasterlin resistant protein 1-like [Anopheles maculipalpis]
MPRRDTRSKSVPPSTRKSTPGDTTKSNQGTPQTTPNNAAEPSKTTASSPTVATPAPGSGLFSQMAATAGGVAIGSVLGRAIGGLFEKSSETKEQRSSMDAVEKPKISSADSTPGAPENDDRSVEECNMEIKQFFSCIDKEVDAKVCEGFKEAMKQCKAKAASRISLFDHL